jgi:hypothetical protein
MKPFDKSAIQSRAERCSGFAKIPSYSYRGQDEKINSISLSGNAPKRESLKYTGTAMIGISTLHKSNSVPVFDLEYAKECAKMRRG